MKKFAKVSLFSVLAFACIALSSCNAQVPKAKLKTDLDSVSYAQGVLYGAQVDRMFTELQIDETNKKDFINGLLKGMKANPDNAKEKAEKIGEFMGIQFAVLMFPSAGEQMFGDPEIAINNNDFLAGYIGMIEDPENTAIKSDEAQMYMMTAMEKIRSKAMEKTHGDAKKENVDFMEKNKSEEGVVTLPSGLQYKVIKEGNGPKPTATDKVKVDYHGTNIYGEVFDSSVQRGEPATFGLNQVISGWTEGIQLMPVGSKYIFYIPYDLAYGPEGRGEHIGPFATLIFEVELHEIVK